jgi:signal transduction histidine kinase
LRRAQREQTLEAASIAPSLVAIDADVDRMIALIDELIDAAHVRAGRALELRLTTTDLVALARACVTDFQTRATQPITLEAAAPTLVGSWDGSRLQRVLQNLLDNAVKYSPPNSRIAVRVSREDGLEGRSGLCCRCRMQEWESPPPISPTSSSGSGAVATSATASAQELALAGAKQIVKQHGGTIRVESVDGVGSMFTVRLPLGPR